MKAFADEKSNTCMTNRMGFVSERAENMVGGNEKMLVTSISSFYYFVFKPFLGLVRLGIERYRTKSRYSTGYSLEPCSIEFGPSNFLHDPEISIDCLFHS